MDDLNSKIPNLYSPPSTDAILWRYMDFTKFVSILENRTLFFARADKLGDPFEGSLPKKNTTQRHPNLSEEERFKYAHVMERLTRYTFISCWHESKYESESMWNRYANENSGIAIRTNPNALAESFITNEQIHIGCVRYVDYDNDIIPEDNGLVPYLYKRKSFESEREVRAIVQRPPNGINLTEISNSIKNLSIEEISKWKDIYETGIDYKVHLELLIQEVVVAHLVPDWFLKLVESVAKRYSLNAPINRSYLAETPTW